MIPRVLQLVAFIMLCCGFGLANPQETPEDVKTGNAVLKSCQQAVRQQDNSLTDQNTTEALNIGYCYGLVEAVVTISPHVCLTPQMKFGQCIRVVVKYLQDNPAELHLNGPRLIEKALWKAFPCH